MINKILIKNVQLDMRPVDIYIEKERIRQIGEQLDVKADKVIDGTDKAVIPGFVNGHTHAAMTLFRGYADDMKLMPWLEEKIWPNEAKMRTEDVYWGSKLACLEMIKSGTTTFLDMYQRFRATADAVNEMGIRASQRTHRPDARDGYGVSSAQPHRGGSGIRPCRCARVFPARRNPRAETGRLGDVTYK